MTRIVKKETVRNTIKTNIAKMSVGHAMAYLFRSISMINNSKPTPLLSLTKKIMSEELKALQVKEFAEGNTFKGYRALTFAEKKVDFDSIQKNLDRLEAAFDTRTRAILHASRETFIAALNKAYESGNVDTIKDVVFRATKEYEKTVKELMKEAYVYGKTNASLEMKLKTPANARAILDEIEVQANAIAGLHVAQIENMAKIKANEALGKGVSTITAVAAADKVISEMIDKLTYDTSRIVMAGYVNAGRDTVFSTYSDKIYALQRSELLDVRTCNYCLSIDGRVIPKTDVFGKIRQFHTNCRGIWVEILLDEQELPPIGGIPKNVRDRFGGTVNDLIQPKTPVTRQDSLARKEVERRAKREANRKNKNK